MVQQHKKELEKQLWNIANALRGNMSADEFRDYILGFIFYKYLSERMDLYADDLLKEDGIAFDSLDNSTDDGKSYLAAMKTEAIDHLGYFLKPAELFHVLAEKGKNGGFILDELSDVLSHIEQSTMGAASEDDFNGLFDDIDLTSNKLGKTPNARNDIIAKVLEHLDAIDFLHSETEIDVLGDAYEYLIGKFASGAGKKAGEFYTPPMVSKLLAKLVTRGRERLRDVYDPTCGSGSLLLRVAKELKAENAVGRFYGQEKNPSTYNLARMNMILHGVHYRSFDIQQDDTLEQPQHLDKRFEAVVANPPFSAKWNNSPSFMQDDRFGDYGKLAPASKADFAFVQHMVHHLAEDGTMAVVLPHGVLFRGAAEGHIRRYLIEQKNCLDTVIGLPANVFYGTSIPTCILVFKTQRQDSDNVLFIDASNHFGKATNQNYLREEDLQRILSAVDKRESSDKFSYVASLNSISEENDFNLNIPRYVDTFEEEETVDLAQTQIDQTEQF
jgi:type I restriction enzyme M protein